ncbi:nicotinate-nucleotide--dimethylbenzimidazole phosphoribosyltransferase [bacterium]|nr:nicotinate-nucleotide--dimethylbenzimidazole phosphoribosyltransferase [bacterium]
MLNSPNPPESAALYPRYLELTMPAGALDALMKPTLQLLAQRRDKDSSPLRIGIVLFAGDHGVARAHSVSAYPAEVTPQMVANIVAGGAAISQLAQRRGAQLWVCDVGVAAGFDELLSLSPGKGIRYRRANLHQTFPGGGHEYGAADISSRPALSAEAHAHCWKTGGEVVDEFLAQNKCDVLILGEMGIGNTTAASALASLVLDKNVDKCVGRGTGIDDAALLIKKKVVAAAVERARHALAENVVNDGERAHALLREVGGAELSAIAGAAWRAAEKGCFVLLDGLIVTAAVTPHAISNATFAQWLMASHQSAELVHEHLLNALGLNPLLKLGLRLGEGSGAALAAGLLQDADTLLRTMATFSSARVSSRSAADEI